ncbi:hypothetical protein AT728_29285 [Streptomyces silvensis]|uniref:Uncharacterized protein n=1 Tax=Streptomyces silvensis TaxID=1765722 RepID=A0A0W7WVT6_9ACTN|nr:hypothetical protein AT728_29285 [Streptomyces silvensis]
MGALVALVALIVAYRRQRVDEDGALREATRLHTERFTTAVSQLEASPAVRLGGAHALAGLADYRPAPPERRHRSPAQRPAVRNERQAGARRRPGSSSRCSPRDHRRPT